MSGGIVFFGDLQASYQNLASCEKVFAQGFKFAQEKKASAIVWLGDLKNSYNPIDIRVVNLVTGFLAHSVKRGIPTYVLLGNHDRVGMYTDGESWLATLGHTGAVVCDKPDVYAVGKQYGLYMLPYRSSLDELKQAAGSLAESTVRNPQPIKILCFHAGVKEANYSETFRSRDTLSINDLYPGRYTYALGGHIHLHQKVLENTWYVGSIFHVDWSESNQKKYFAYVE